MLKKIGMFQRTAKKLGLYKTLKWIAQDIKYDLIAKIDTTKIVELDKLKIEFDTKDCVEYCPTSTVQLNEIFQALSTKIKHEKNGFLDYGCGKGRVLITAQQNGYKSIVGVEFSEELAKIAKNNAKKLGLNNIDIITNCATQYEIEQTINVIYMFNPFHGKTLKKVIENIKQYKLSSNKKIILIYVNPVLKNYFREFTIIYISKNDFIIYEL